MIVGNDISSFQGDPNFDTYKNNSNFIIIKATEGIKFIDPKLNRNQSESRRVGLPLGYYHFARPTYGNDPIKEADYFLSAIGKLNDGEFLCLDFEETYGDAVNWCKKWLDRVFEKTGVSAFIYMDQSRVSSYNWTSLVNSGYALWIAAYIDGTNFKTGSWPSAAMQQWTSSQKVPGINGNVDGDRFFGDQTSLKKYGYKSSDPCSVQNAQIEDLKKKNDELQKQNEILKGKISRAQTDLA